jgi:shikimate dehydrogenase
VFLTGRARLAGVMGWPVSHSRSPSLHGHWFARYGIDGTYVPLPVRPEDVELAFRALPRVGFLGWNVTVPHKEIACRLVDQLDPMAERIGAVNTVLVDPDGRTRGLNSDGIGFLANLRQQAPDWRPEDGPVLVLGAGGSARAVAAALLDAGVPALRFANRTPVRAEGLAREFAAFGPTTAIGWGEVAAALRDTRLLVNCTSLGMTGQPALEVDLAALPVPGVVADLVYAPLETALLAEAKRRGHVAVEGLGMLLQQAATGFAHWGGVVPEVDQRLRAAVLGAG